MSYISLQKAATEVTLNCASCKQPLTDRLTLHQCGHSYCEQCLKRLPRTEQEGQKGWLCSQCKLISTEIESLKSQSIVGDFPPKKTETQNTLACTLCKEPTSNPCTLHHCSHSYCEQCLNSLPKTELDGQKGWLCVECKIISTEIDSSKSPSVTSNASSKKTTTESLKSPSVTSGESVLKTATDSLNSPNITSDASIQTSNIALLKQSSKVSDASVEKTPTESLKSPSIGSGESVQKSTTDSVKSPSITSDASIQTSTIKLLKSPSKSSEASVEKTATESTKSPSITSDASAQKSTADESLKSPSDVSVQKATAESLQSPSITSGESVQKTAAESVKSPSVGSGESAQKSTAESVKSPSITSGESIQKTTATIDKSVEKSNTESLKSPSIASSTTSVVADCTLCKKPASNPCKLGQCGHSYCEQCLLSLRKSEKDGQKGWLCSECGKITAESDVLKSSSVVSVVPSLKSIITDVVECEMCKRYGTSRQTLHENLHEFYQKYLLDVSKESQSTTSSNISLGKTGLEEVIECSWCKRQLTDPQTLQECLHSYCKQCLHNLARVEQDGQKGWLCNECRSFSAVVDVKGNSFIEELKNVMCTYDKEKPPTVECKQCLSHSARKRCKECKIELCRVCQEAHLRIPMLKDHHFYCITEESQIVDKAINCAIHTSKPIEYNCKTCNVPTCSICNGTGHLSHEIETVAQAVERLLPELESRSDDVVVNCNKIQTQVDAVTQRINETKDSFTAIRTKLSGQVEKMVNSLNTLKAQKESEIKKHETIALEELEGVRQGLEGEQCKLKNVCLLARVTAENSRNTTLLTQIQKGLLNRLKKFSEMERKDVKYKLSTGIFRPSDRTVELIKERWNEMCGEVLYNSSSFSLDKSGVKWSDNGFMCEDFSVFTKTEMEQCLEIQLPKQWCNGLTYVSDKLCVGFPNHDELRMFSTSGKLLKTINTERVTTLRVAGNGDYIAAGIFGLYSTNEDFSDWKKISSGKYSGLFIHGRYITALRYDILKVITFELKVNKGGTSKWTERSSFGLPTDHFTLEDWVNRNNKILVNTDGELIISKCGNYRDRAVFQFSQNGALLDFIRTDWEPAVCGIDKKGRMMVASYDPGKLYIVKSIQELGKLKQVKEVQMEECESLWYSIVDNENNLWTLQGDDIQFKLQKFCTKFD